MHYSYLPAGAGDVASRLEPDTCGTTSAGRQDACNSTYGEVDDFTCSCRVACETVCVYVSELALRVRRENTVATDQATQAYSCLTSGID